MMKTVLILLATVCIALYRINAWNYIENSEYGPKKWSLKYPQCQGTLQSPINIQFNQVTFSTQLLSFELPGYESIPEGAHWELYNNGNFLVIRLSGDYIVREGGLNGQFRAVEMHFRWGRDPRQGSEHVFNASTFPMELQILHYNTKYASYDEACLQADGLAAFSFLFKTNGRDNPTLFQITRNLEKVKLKEQSVVLRPVPLLSLLPINLNDFYRYEGSLTHPPCTENVLWTVFTEYMDISSSQLAMFRKFLLRGYKQKSDAVMVASKRVVQPLHGRVVYSSRMQDATIWTAPLSPISITLAVFLGFVILFLVLGKQQKLDIEEDASVESVTLTTPTSAIHPASPPVTCAYNALSNAEHHLD